MTVHHHIPLFTSSNKLPPSSQKAVLIVEHTAVTSPQDFSPPVISSCLLHKGRLLYPPYLYSSTAFLVYWIRHPICSSTSIVSVRTDTDAVSFFKCDGRPRPCHSYVAKIWHHPGHPPDTLSNPAFVNNRDDNYT